MQELRKGELNYLPLLLAITVAGLLVVALARYDSPTEKTVPSPQDSRAIMRTEALLDGIPQHGAALGTPKAPVTLQFIGDLQCRQSRQVMLGALPLLIRHWVRNGKLRIVFRSFETDTHGISEFLGQQIAALAAGRQEKMWTFIDLFYREQLPEFTHYADDVFLEGIAEQAGVSLGRWAEDRKSRGWIAMIESGERRVMAKRIESTPSFLVGPTGGETHRLRHFSFDEPRVFDEAIRELL